MARIKLFDPAPKPPPQKKPPAPPKDPPLFDQLFPCAFRGIQFPVSTISISSQQDIVEHKYWNVDGARVEMTGQQPATIEAEIPFVNGIVPGKNERWGVLYPTTFREFLVAFNNKDSGVLDTPEFSGLVVKPVSIEFKHDAGVRDGVMVTARWIETIDESVETAPQVSQIEAARLAALTLDSELPKIKDTIYEPPEFPETFETLMNNITGIVDTNASRLKLLANKPNQILYRIKRLQSSLDRAANALTWPASHALDELESAVNDLKRLPDKVEAIVVGKKVYRYTARTRMTPQQLAQATGNSIDDLLLLNPKLASRPAVPPGTVVRYYNNAGILSQFPKL